MTVLFLLHTPTHGFHKPLATHTPQHYQKHWVPTYTSGDTHTIQIQTHPTGKSANTTNRLVLTNSRKTKHTHSTPLHRYARYVLMQKSIYIPLSFLIPLIPNTRPPCPQSVPTILRCQVRLGLEPLKMPKTVFLDYFLPDFNPNDTFRPQKHLHYSPKHSLNINKWSL